MVDNDITYCNGIGCGIKEFCRRYTEGLAIKANLQGDTNQHRWWDYCDGDYHDGFLMKN